MPFVPVDINSIKMDQPSIPSGYVPVDINSIKLDAPSAPSPSPSVNQKKQSVGRTALEQGLQGATFNFGDEITDRLGAAGASLWTGEKYGDLLKEARGMSKERLSQQMQQNPGTAFASNLGGALLTGGAGASTKAGAALGGSLRSGSLPARIAKGVLSGGVSGAAYGAGGAEDGKMAEGAKSGAIYGAALGGAIPAVGAGLRGAKNTIFGKTVATSDDIKKLAQESYKYAADKGGVLKSDVANKFVQQAESASPQTEAGRLLSGDSPVTKLVEKIKGLRDKPLTLDAVQEIDEFLGDSVDEFVDRTTSGLSKQGKKILDVQTSFRKLIDDVSDTDVVGGKEGFGALKEGKRLWSSFVKMKDIEKIISRAEMMDNPATGIKTGFRNLYGNAARIRGYDEETKRLIKKAAETGYVTDLLRTMGSRLIPIVTAASGGGLGGTAAAQAASMASRGAATRVQLNKAGAVSKSLADKALGVSKGVSPDPSLGKAALLAQILAGQQGAR